jgi:hypothetical protein
MTAAMGFSPAYLFTEGGAGDPPGAVVVTPGCENSALFLSMPPSVPSVQINRRFQYEGDVGVGTQEAWILKAISPFS